MLACQIGAPQKLVSFLLAFLQANLENLGYRIRLASASGQDVSELCHTAVTEDPKTLIQKMWGYFKDKSSVARLESFCLQEAKMASVHRTERLLLGILCFVGAVS